MKPVYGLLACFLPYVAHGAVNITFSDGDSFEGDDAGDSAGPFTDAVTGVTGIINTHAVFPDGVLNPNSLTLGINATSGDFAGRFDVGEYWTFSWNVATRFEGIDFGLYSVSGEAFTLRSDAFAGLAITPDSSLVTHSAEEGIFSFSVTSTYDDFNLSDLSGGTPLMIPANVPITISFTSTSTGDNATVEGMTFSLVPEPGNALVGVLIGAGFLRRRRCRSTGRSPEGMGRSGPSPREGE